MLIVSSGDPVSLLWRLRYLRFWKLILNAGGVEIEILPGITAMLAAAAQAGAPLGHDFCVINPATIWNLGLDRKTAAAGG